MSDTQSARVCSSVCACVCVNEKSGERARVRHSAEAELMKVAAMANGEALRNDRVTTATDTRKRK